MGQQGDRSSGERRMKHAMQGATAPEGALHHAIASGISCKGRRVSRDSRGSRIVLRLQVTRLQSLCLKLKTGSRIRRMLKPWGHSCK